MLAVVAFARRALIPHVAHNKRSFGGARAWATGHRTGIEIKDRTSSNEPSCAALDWRWGWHNKRGGGAESLCVWGAKRTLQLQRVRCWIFTSVHRAWHRGVG